MKRIDRAFLKIARDDALRSQNHRCKYCRDSLTYKNATIEHIVPKSVGGSNRKENIAASCFSCNQLKSSLSEIRFKKIIKSVDENSTVEEYMAWFRYKTNSRLEKAIDRISKWYRL